MLVRHEIIRTCHGARAIPTTTTIQKSLQMPHMLMWCLTEDNHVISVTSSKMQAKKDMVHHSLKPNR